MPRPREVTVATVLMSVCNLAGMVFLEPPEGSSAGVRVGMAAERARW